MASYNVENLDGLDAQERYDRVADQIVGNLRSPDILSLEEIQDNDGAVVSPSTQSNITHERLIEAIEDAGGPRYDYRQIDPAPNSDGGEPGGNIRVSFLFRTDVPDLRFVDRPGGNAITPTDAGSRSRRCTADVQPGPRRPDEPRVEQQPQAARGRVPLPRQAAVRGRQPLQLQGRRRPGVRALPGAEPHERAAAAGQRDEPGRHRPRPGRRAQRFVRDLLDIDPRARVVVLGDLNDFDFSETLRVVEQGPSTSSGPELVNLWSLLPRSERYSYIFQGNAQTLDHILVSPALLSRAGRTSTPST